MWFLNIMLIFLSFFLSVIYYVKHKFSYWERKGVAFLRPSLPYGNINESNPKEHASLTYKRFYEELKGKGPFQGVYIFVNPIVFATDLEFIKNIFVKDFNYFMNRGSFHNPKDEPLSGNLFQLENQRWREIRVKLTPTFTSGKMKNMFPMIIKVAEEFENCIANELKISSEIEMREIVGRFTTDVIGTCAFGIDCNSLKNPDAKFREMGNKVFAAPRHSRVVCTFMASFPNFAKLLHLKALGDDVSEFFMGVVRDTVNYREGNNIYKNDFMDLLIKLKNQEAADPLTFKEVAAQCFVFFLAGFETSTTVLAFALYELSLNQEIQDKARHEVQRVLKQNNGKLLYESMLEMKYVEQIINESLRKYPPFYNLTRQINKDFIDPISGVLLEKGLKVAVPVYAIHHDPEYYPNPEEFNPDRFTQDEVRKRKPYSFLPFGEGPRNCIGLRFGMMQARIALAIILSSFKFKRSQNMKVPLVLKPNTFILASDSGVYVNVEKIH